MRWVSRLVTLAREEPEHDGLCGGEVKLSPNGSRDSSSWDAKWSLIRVITRTRIRSFL